MDDSCSALANSCDLAQVVGQRAADDVDRAELSEKFTRISDCDHRDRAEHVDGNLVAATDRSTVRRLNVARPETGSRHRQAPKPRRRILSSCRPKNRNASIGQSDQGATHCIARQRAGIQVRTFDQHDWQRSIRSQTIQLGPETTIDDRSVEIAYRLAFDECCRANRVVSDRERRSLDYESKPLQRADDSARALSMIRNDRQQRSVDHSRRMSHHG